MAALSQTEFAARIETTQLSQTAMRDHVEHTAQAAAENGFATCCVRAERISWIIDHLRDTLVRPCAAIGYQRLRKKSERERFLKSAVLTDYDISLNEKLSEIALVLEVLDTQQVLGVVEFDILLNYAEFFRGDRARFEEECRHLVEQVHQQATAHGRGVVVKLISENLLLNEEEKQQVAQWIQASKADFIKICSGFTPGGATLEDVRLVRTQLGDSLKIKVSGGITPFTYQRYLDAGADRIGTSQAVDILLTHQHANSTEPNNA